MENYKYLIIGGGMSADAAVKGTREIDPQGSIGLFSLETDPPYKRPPLTKGLWKGKSFESIWLNTESHNVAIHLEQKIVFLEAGQLVARDDQGNEFQSEKVLLATGGRPRRLAFGEDIIYYRKLPDYRRLAAMSASGQDFAVIGAGFIGPEIAAALAMVGKKVSMVFPGKGIGARIYPQALSQFLNDFFQKKGVEILAGEKVASLTSHGKQRILKTLGGCEVIAKGIVAGLGIELNLALANAAGLQVGNGISVDENLVTSHPNIYAAGDVAEFYNPALGKRLRLEREDNAKSMGRQAGRNMTGASEPFHYLPYFYSDLFELGYEAVGELDSQLETAADWAEPFQKGIIYYFREQRVCGVLLWNVWDKVPMARELIAQPGPFKPEDLKAKNSAGWKIAE